MARLTTLAERRTEASQIDRDATAWLERARQASVAAEDAHAYRQSYKRALWDAAIVRRLPDAQVKLDATLYPLWMDAAHRALDMPGLYGARDDDGIEAIRILVAFERGHSQDEACRYAVAISRRRAGKSESADQLLEPHVRRNEFADRLVGEERGVRDRARDLYSRAVEDAQRDLDIVRRDLEALDETDVTAEWDRAYLRSAHERLVAFVARSRQHDRA